MGIYTGSTADDVITPAQVSDAVSVTGAARPSAAADTLMGGAGADTLDAGAGNDSLDGGFGVDLIRGGLGDDTVAWSPGGGSDFIDGGPGSDTLAFNGANIGEEISLWAELEHVALTRNIATVTLDLLGIDRLALRTFGGADTIGIGDLAFTGLTKVDIDLGASAGGGDAAADIVRVGGASTNDRFAPVTAGGVTAVTAAGVTVNISQAEAADRLALAGGAGADTLDATAAGGGIGLDFDGGEGVDVYQLRGGTAADTIQLFGINSDGVAGDAFGFDMNGAFAQGAMRQVETVSVAGGDGDDRIFATHLLLEGSAVLLDGGNGADTILGGHGNETVQGGAGNDVIDGNRDFDVLRGGAGDDTFQWDPGDGGDLIDGGSGADTLAFNGSNAGELIDLSANGDVALLIRNIGAVTQSLLSVERLALRTLGSADTVTIGDIAATGLRKVEVDLGDFTGVGDLAADVVRAGGTGGNDKFTVVTAGGVSSVTAAGVAVSVRNGEAADRLALMGGGAADTLDGSAAAGGIGLTFDGGDGADVFLLKGGTGADTIGLYGNGSRGPDGDPFAFEVNGAVAQGHLRNVETLSVAGGDGDDRIFATTLLSESTRLVLDGGNGADTVVGGHGAETLNGGAGADSLDGNRGNDVVRGGAGDDTIQWDPGDGSDSIDGGSDIDTLAFYASNAGEIIELQANGSHVALTRNIGTVTLDLNAIDRLALRTLGGEDVILLGNLFGTGLRQADIDLAANGGGGDGAVDVVQIAGGAARDRVTVTSDAAGVHVKGLPTELNLTGAEAADRLVVTTLDGADTIDLTGFAGGLALSVNGGAGSDRFQFGPGTPANVQIEAFRPHALDGAAGDVVALTGFADTTFAQAVANSHIVQSGGDVVIQGGGGVIATLRDVSLGSLGASDFVFG